MATLSSKSATIEVRPVRKETSTSNWLETVVGITYHIQEQRLHVELPASEISMQIEEFEKLICKGQDYIASLPVGKHSKESTIKSYSFSPMESRFALTLSSGIFSDDSRTNGGMTVSFEMSLTTLQAHDILLDSIACSLYVNISDVLQFLNQLDQEVKTMAPA